MKHQLSITTDYIKDTGSPEPYLKRISETNFSHVPWCHEWNTDYLYSESEISQITIWLKKYNLKILDIHASSGKEKDFLSPDEHIRKAGVELVKNRISMANKLSCDVIILHFQREPNIDSENKKYWRILYKTFDELTTHAKSHNVQIALENFQNEDCHEIKALLSKYGPDVLGLCYDSGHGNIGNGLKHLDELKNRLISIHLHDNDGKTDQHQLLFSGTVDWDRLAKIIALSSYDKCISTEIRMDGSGISDESLFLSKAHAAGLKFSEMMHKYSHLV